jgi:hypothetical protein
MPSRRCAWNDSRKARNSRSFRKMLPALRNLVPALRNLVRTLRNLVPTLRNLVPAVRNLVPAVRNLVPTLRNLVPAVRNLVPALRNLVRTLRNLVRTLRNLVRTLRNLVRTLRNLVPRCGTSSPRCGTLMIKIKEVRRSFRRVTARWKERKDRRYVPWPPPNDSFHSRVAFSFLLRGLPCPLFRRPWLCAFRGAVFLYASPLPFAKFMNR